MTFRKPVAMLWTFLIFTGIGLFFALHQHLDDLIYNPGISLQSRLLYELSGAWGAMVMLPFLNWVAQRFPFSRSTVWRALGANLLAFPVYTLGHTAANDILRFTLAPLLGVPGVGPFNMLIQTSSEASNDTVYFGMLMATIYLVNHFIKTQGIETKLAEARLENLRLQLQPHFLFNTLNAISSVMYEDVRKADRMLSSLSDFLRAVLATSGVQAVPIDEELRIEQMYVDIMKTRLERNLHLGVRVGEGAGGALVPFMLLQPLLENSIRHGMGSERKSIDLDIDVTRRNGSTVIRVGDDGIGYTTTACDGIGLSNVRARLHYMYGEDATFAIEARSNGGTIATITLPFKEGALE